MSESGNQPTKLTTPITLSSNQSIVIPILMLVLFTSQLVILMIARQYFLSAALLLMILLALYFLLSTAVYVVAGPDGLQCKCPTGKKLIPWEDIQAVRIGWNKSIEMCIIRYGHPRRTLRFVINDRYEFRNTDWLMEVIAYQADLRFVRKTEWDTPIYKREQEVG